MLTSQCTFHGRPPSQVLLTQHTAVAEDYHEKLQELEDLSYRTEQTEILQLPVDMSVGHF